MRALRKQVKEHDDLLAFIQNIVDGDFEKQAVFNQSFKERLGQQEEEIRIWFVPDGIIGWIIPYIHSLKNILGYIDPLQVEEHQGDDNV